MGTVIRHSCRGSIATECHVLQSIQCSWGLNLSWSRRKLDATWLSITRACSRQVAIHHLRSWSFRPWGFCLEQGIRRSKCFTYRYSYWGWDSGCNFCLDVASVPGPDGFSGFFYHKCWDIISQDVIHVISFFFTTMVIPRGMNSRFVALIPKASTSIRVTDFRPIVIGNCTYKLYTKIIATRLGSFVGELL